MCTQCVVMPALLPWWYTVTHTCGPTAAYSIFVLCHTFVHTRVHSTMRVQSHWHVTTSLPPVSWTHLSSAPFLQLTPTQSCLHVVFLISHMCVYTQPNTSLRIPLVTSLPHTHSAHPVCRGIRESSTTSAHAQRLCGASSPFSPHRGLSVTSLP